VKDRRTAVVVAVGVILGGAVGAATVRFARAQPVTHVAHAVGPRARVESEPVIVVPRAAGEITIDGELEDPGWSGPMGRTGAFTTSDGRAAHPYSDARFVHRNGQLFVVLYAADEDIRATDARHDDPLYDADVFQLTLRTTSGEFSIDVSSAGVVTDARRSASGALDFGWESHARVAVDRDGTANDPSDQDEEWVIEMAIPLDAIGVAERSGERIGVELHRCDTVPHFGRVCSAWAPLERGRALVLNDDDIR
jgi:hypothetical protein